MNKNIVLNLKPLKKDRRDYKYKDTGLMAKVLPISASNKKDFNKVYNQEHLGTCYAFGGVYLMEQRRTHFLLPKWELSKMFLSYVIRLVEANGNPKSPELYKDNGASIRDTAKGMEKYGTVLEVEYPYKSDINYFKQIPPDFNLKLTTAGRNRVKTYTFLANTNEIKDAIARGYCVGIGIMVYESFMNIGKKVYNFSNKTGYRGGHFVTIHSYNDEEQAFECINSWGTWHGVKGHFKMDYNAMQDSLDKYGAFIVGTSYDNLPKPTLMTKIKNWFR